MANIPDQNTPLSQVAQLGTPQEGKLVPNTLDPADKGPVYAKFMTPPGSAVSDVNPVPPGVPLRQLAAGN